MGFTLAVCPADTEMMCNSLFYSCCPLVKEAVKLFFSRGEPLDAHGIKEPFPQALYGSAEIKISGAVDLLAKCLFIHFIQFRFKGPD